MMSVHARTTQAEILLNHFDQVFRLNLIKIFELKFNRYTHHGILELSDHTSLTNTLMQMTAKIIMCKTHYIETDL